MPCIIVFIYRAAILHTKPLLWTRFPCGGTCVPSLAHKFYGSLRVCFILCRFLFVFEYSLCQSFRHSSSGEVASVSHVHVQVTGWIPSLAPSYFLHLSFREGKRMGRFLPFIHIVRSLFVLFLKFEKL